MENSQEGTINTAKKYSSEKTETSNYSLSELRSKQGSPDRKVVRAAIPMSEALKRVLKNIDKPKETKEKLIEKKEFIMLFWNNCLNFYGQGKHYVIDDQNRKVVLELLSYFSRSEMFGSQGVVKNEASLDKGILLFGPCGVGKSDLFEIFRRVGRFLAKYGYMQLYFIDYTAKEIVKNKEELNKKKSERIPNFKPLNLNSGTIYIDDVGTEPKFFGQEVIGDLFQERYMKSKRKLQKTLITSNMNPSELSEKYGIQVEDRIPEMFNIIKWEGDSRR